MLTRTGVEIRDVAIRDNVRITRTYTVPTFGPQIEKSWMTVKLRESAPDTDALFQKEITTSNSPDGQITDADAANGDLAMNFEILEADTVAARVGIPYRYDVKVKWQGEAKAHTLETGKIFFIRGVTAAVS
jgi:hypothetical protein